jgi:hypothetical protein
VSGPSEDAIVREASAAGMPAAEAARLLGASEWPQLLRSPAGEAVGRSLGPAGVAGELRARRRCGICGHPLHWSAAPVVLSIGGAPRRVRHLPHVAACSCGYAGPGVLPAWLEALERHCAANPGEHEVDALRAWP